MSKVGRVPVKIAKEVITSVSGNTLTVKGPKGELKVDLPSVIAVEIADGEIKLTAKTKTKNARTLHGTYRALVSNMVVGVTSGWLKVLEIVGTGYRAEVKGKDLSLVVGFSHPVTIEAPQGIDFKVEKNVITVEGIDKELVGQIAANIRGVRPPEPYKGKGIRYKDEEVRRKPGKAAKAAGT